MNFLARLKHLSTAIARESCYALRHRSAQITHPRVTMAGADVSIANIVDGRGNQHRAPPGQRALKRCADHLSALCDPAATIQSP